MFHSEGPGAAATLAGEGCRRRFRRRSSRRAELSTLARRYGDADYSPTSPRACSSSSLDRYRPFRSSSSKRGRAIGINFDFLARRSSRRLNQPGSSTGGFFPFGASTSSRTENGTRASSASSLRRDSLSICARKMRGEALTTQRLSVTRILPELLQRHLDGRDLSPEQLIQKLRPAHAGDLGGFPLRDHTLREP